MIHTALHHDKIIENQEPDFALVEIEAEKIANEAVRALKESRKYCKPAESGIPNLVGVKFGSKLKIQAPKSDETKPDSNFVSSKSLLDRIKLRNQGIHVDNNTSFLMASNESKQGKSDNGDGDDDEDDSAADLNSSNPIDRSVRMTKMIQKYMTKISKNFNRASTEQIVEYFRDKIEKSDTVKFKALLKQMCNFNKSSTKGFWSMKDEYL